MNNWEKLPRLDWQNELDASMSDIDDRLTHPRRRATDVGPRPNLTPEMMDEIAWRVADQLRKHGLEVPARRGAVVETLAPSPDVELNAPVDDVEQLGPKASRTPSAPKAPLAPRAPVAPPAPPAPSLLPGKMVMLRYRMPSLPWPFRLLFRRRKQHPLTTAKLRA